jgi:polyphenol oxidase
MVIIKSQLFQKFPEIIFGFSTIIGLKRTAPYYFNMSKSVGDDEKTVNINRESFFNGLGLGSDTVAAQMQDHTDIITYVSESGNFGRSDALITDKVNLGLAVSSADCNPIFLYDFKNRIIAGVHSGWRGTELRILEKTLSRLKNDFNSAPQNIAAYLGPSICQEEYEVGSEFKDKFASKYLEPKGDKFLLDVAGANYDMLINFGVEKKNIQKSILSSFQLSNLLHSYRRDGLKSGRALGVIALKG